MPDTPRKKRAKQASKLFEITPDHHTSISDLMGEASTYSLYGKLMQDLQPTSDGHRFAQVFGYKQNDNCTQLPSPIVIALPDPDGPADDCGYPPDQYLVWHVPSSFGGPVLNVTHGALRELLPASSADRLTASQSLAIVSGCIRAVTGSKKPLDPSAALNWYGVNSAQQVSQVTANIVGDPGLGVLHYGFTLKGSVLATVGSSTTVSQLSTLISSNAVPKS